jgi:hypothetical protein
MKEYQGVEVVDSNILTLGTAWRSMVSFTFWLLGGHQSQFELFAY